MAGLGATRANRAEHDFLRARVAVVDARLKALRYGELPVLEAVAQPEAGSRVSPTARHRNDIQGLRAVAVLLVALAHSRIGFLSGGFVGVDVFFVLSGFLITGLLVAEARRRRWVSLADFYLRRARRILPAATLTLLVSDIAAYHLLNFVRAKQYVQDSIASVLFAANVHFANQGTNYFAQGQPPSPVQHFWSLAVEEQFYVVWPLLFILVVGLAVRRHTPRPRKVGQRALGRTVVLVGLIALASLVWSIHDTAAQPAAAYFSTLARAWELALGALLALGQERLLAFVNRWRLVLGWVGLAAIVAAAVAYSSTTPFPGYAALLPTLGAALVIAAGAGASAARASVAWVLGTPPLRYIGDRSYAFYLWHWPVLVIAEQRAGHQLSVATNLLLLLGAFALSVVSYRLVEQPIRTAAWARAPQALTGFACAVIAVVVVATAITTSISNREAVQAAVATPVTPLSLPTTSVPTPSPARLTSSSALTAVLPEVVRQVQSGPARNALPSNLAPPIGRLLADVAAIPAGCEAQGTQSSEDVCHLGDAAGARSLAVVGDSHAEMWLPAIERFAARDGWDVIPIMKSGCSPTKWTSAGDPERCVSWFRWAMHEVAGLHPTVSLVTGFFSEVSAGATPTVLSGLSSAVQTLKRASHRVVVVGDVPTRSRQPVDCLLAAHASATSCIDALSDTESQLDTDVAGLAAGAGVAYIDPTGWFCYQAQCPLVVGQLITYRDETHVSATYAAALTNVFRAAFTAAVKSGR